MHSVHFFITPTSSSNSRAPYGQAQEHSLQPMQRSSLTSTMPPSARLKGAPVGHTVTQAGCSQGRQERGKCTVRPFAPSPASKLWMRLNHTPDGESPQASESASGAMWQPLFPSFQLPAQG